MRIGVCLLPELPWREAAPLWRRVEELGFDHAWTYDHLVWAGLPSAPWHSTVATLAAAAAVTDRIGLGTFVASPNFRHPALLAKDATTLDDISGGRFLLGLGAGGDLDAALLGQRLTRGERTRRFAEFVPLLDRLLTRDRVDHDGEFFTVEGMNSRPRCHQEPRVPFVVAANGPRGIDLAARTGEGWLTIGRPGDVPGPEAPITARLEAWWTGVGELSRIVDEAEERADRLRPLDRYLSLDASGIPVLGTPGLTAEMIERAAALGFTDVVVHHPRPDDPYRADPAALEELAAGR